MPSLTRHNKAAYWRSLDELAETPAFRQFVEAEFPTLAPELDKAGPTRRRFLQLMGASFALAGLTACRWPKETIVPATRQPGNRIPGETVQYATAWELDAVATGLLVTSYDGRPIKIEGNERHPYSLGKSDARMQAAILELYDPDRSVMPIKRPVTARHPEGWSQFRTFARAHFDVLRGKGGAGLAILSEASSSPSLTVMHARLLAAFPHAQWFEYEPLSRDNAREGSRRVFGRPHRTHLNLDQADVIVSFEDDFLMEHPAALRHAHDFAQRRRGERGMNRLHVFESDMSVTGSVADQRHAVRPSAIGSVLLDLAHRLKARLSAAGGPSLPQPAGESAVANDALDRLADELVAARGRCVITVGPGQPPAVHALGLVLNEWLGAFGATLTFTMEPDADRPTHVASLTRLVEQMNAGRVDTLVILGGNPAYNAPADLAFGEALQRVATSIHLSLYDDETSQACAWHVPRAHFLESWGDTRAWDGTMSIVQPLIAPLYEGLTPCELLALLAGDEVTTGYDIARRTIGTLFDRGVDRAKLWEHALHDGVVPDTAWPKVAPSIQAGATLGDLTPAAADAYEIAFRPDYAVHDGRFANNAWLQEWPDPISKLTWDNAALVSPADAKKLGLKKSGDRITVVVQQRTLKLPAYILPGHARGAITIPLGYGRPRAAGLVADGAGFDAYRLRDSGSMNGAVADSVRRTGSTYKLATTQDHHAIKSAVGDREIQDRLPQLIREATYAAYRHDPAHAFHHGEHLPVAPLWSEREVNAGHRWGMAIDLSACIGCGACVLACQSENNIPVVGKEEVAKGREMHWIRVDRYFKAANPEASISPDPLAPAFGEVQIAHQPVTCVQCENAPCEQVCPVAATVHDTEGLNSMVYNRCIGTRYCSNNCPYKVRRFNWFYNHHGPYHPRSLKAERTQRKDGVNILPGEYRKQPLSEIEKLAHNPEVTVRSRGVMEKCTYCIQRINKVKIKARNERRDIRDGEITPACAQACPTSAIVFGDLNDPESRVSKLHQSPRAYDVLGELYLKPRTLYLAKLRNPAEHAGANEKPAEPAHGAPAEHA